MMEDKSNFATFKVPEKEIQWRLKRVQHILRAENMEALLVLQRVDLFYFSGTSQNGALFIPAEGKPLLLVKKYLPRAIAESPLSAVLPIQSIRDIPEKIIDYYGRLPECIGFEWDVMPLREFQFYQQLFKNTPCVDGSHVIHAVRSIKSDWELARLASAAGKSLQVFDYIGKQAKPGESDIEIAARAESFARSLGHGAVLRIRDYQKSGFPLSHFVGGKHCPHHALSQPSLREGTSVVIEPGGRLYRGKPITIESRFFLDGYHMHETRTCSIGPLTPAVQPAAQRLLELHHEILAEIKPEISGAALFKIFRDKGRTIGVDRWNGVQSQSEKGVLGWAIGLELAEPPIIGKGCRQIIKQGMVLSIFLEYRDDHGHYLSTRDVILVTENGHRRITRTPSQILVW